MTSMIEKAARALCEAQGYVPSENEIARAADEARAVLQAIREPDEAMIAEVVQKVGDPTPEQWALAERTCERLGVVSMNGERACAELARDWQAMLDTILNPQDTSGSK